MVDLNFRKKAKSTPEIFKECIPVGCVPPASMVILWVGGGGVAIGVSRGVSTQGGFYPGG